jgi:hypothetical protein
MNQSINQSTNQPTNKQTKKEIMTYSCSAFADVPEL